MVGPQSTRMHMRKLAVRCARSKRLKWRVIILYLRDEIEMYERALAKDTNPLGWSFSIEPLEGDAEAIWKSPRFNKIRGLRIRDEYRSCLWNTDYPIEGVTTAAKEKEWVEEQFRGYSMALWRSFNELSLEEKTAIFPERMFTKDYSSGCAKRIAIKRRTFCFRFLNGFKTTCPGNEWRSSNMSDPCNKAFTRVGSHIKMQNASFFHIALTACLLTLHP